MTLHDSRMDPMPLYPLRFEPMFQYRPWGGRRLADQLASFRPKPGDGIFIPAGTVHSLGDLVVFEVQENSDVTFRVLPAALGVCSCSSVETITLLELSLPEGL